MADITPDTGKKNTETAVPALTIEGLSSGNSATRDSSDFTGRGDSSQGPDFGVTNEVMKTAQAAGGGSSAQASREMEVAGIVPAVAFMGDGFTDFAPVMEPRDIIEKYASAQDKMTFNDFDALAEKTGAPKFTDQQKIQFMNMPEDQKQMFRTTLEELGKLSDNKISPAQYVSNTLMNAAKMAEANGRPPDSWNIFHKSSQMYYRDYVGMVFSEPPLGFTRDLARGLAGTAFNLPGSGLENIYKSLTNKPNAGDSFNPNVVDVEVTNSITHHHRELLLAGYNNGHTPGMVAHSPHGVIQVSLTAI